MTEKQEVSGPEEHISMEDVIDSFDRLQVFLDGVDRHKVLFDTEKPAKDERLVPNTGGGDSYKVSDDTHVRRFLILGSAGGSYYVSEEELTMQTVESMIKIIKKGKGAMLLRELVEISLAGRAPKQDPTLFCLALCAKAKLFADPGVEGTSKKKYEAYLEQLQKAAIAALPKVCRIPTHLFGFVDFCEKICKETTAKTGWGRQMRRGITDWYLKTEPKTLAMHITKYGKRNGWSHADLLRLAHVQAKKSENPLLYDHILHFAVTGNVEARKNDQDYVPEKKKPRNYDLPSNAHEMQDNPVLLFLERFQWLKELKADENNVYECVRLINENKFVREHVPTDFLNYATVWKALLPHMPMTALIRSLSKLSTVDLITGKDPKNDEYVQMVVDKIDNEENLKKARIHPLNVLIAMTTYNDGHGLKGKLRWEVNRRISKALESAFYKSFKNVLPTGKRYLLAFDVSGSMWSPVYGSQIQCAQASMALGMVALRTEPVVETVCFSEGIMRLPLTPEMSLEQIMAAVEGINFSATDCSLPMKWAMKHKKSFDVFIVYTDSETNCNDIPPAEAIRKYREVMGIPDAKLIVMGMQLNQFSIADPQDRNMLDVAGFDSAVPEIIRGFVVGEI